MKKLIIAVLLVLLFALPYFIFDGEKYILDESTRNNAPGNFIKLSQGFTHYEIVGPADGAPVVLVHGYSIPYFLWKDTARQLGEAGFRVIMYDMYGRGYSDRPESVYNPDLFDSQLLELLDALKINDKIYLAGISMGGAVSADFTARHPERVNKLIMISPFGLPQELGFLAEMIKAPFIGEYMMAVAGDRVMKARLDKNFYKPRNIESIRPLYIEQMKYKGYKRALLSTMRHFMSLDFTPVFNKVGRLDIPVLLIWGRKDAVVPFELSRNIIKAVPKAEFVPLDNNGHVPTLENPDLISQIMIEFLNN